MKPIRCKVVCVFRDAGRILVLEGLDPATGERFLFPVGGGMEFGETSEAALIREVREELGAEITAVRRLGLLENRFTFNGVPEHEIVFVFDARFQDAACYATKRLPVVESNGERFVAEWRNVASLRKGAVPLYPAGLLDLAAR